MPSWQSDAVAEYLATDGLPSVSERGYNVSGRAVPDISMQAADFCVSPFGCSVAGTSCASPTAAGVIALLNDLRLQAGKSTLGFLNNFLYQNSGAFSNPKRISMSYCVTFTRCPLRRHHWLFQRLRRFGRRLAGHIRMGRRDRARHAQLRKTRHSRSRASVSCDGNSEAIPPADRPGMVPCRFPARRQRGIFVTLSQISGIE